MSNKPTKWQIRNIMFEIDIEQPNISESSYWVLVHNRLNLEYGEIFDIIAKDPKFFDLNKDNSQTVRSANSSAPKD